MSKKTQQSGATTIMASPISTPTLSRVFQVGERWDDFEIIRVLGKGGFAIVYLARQVSLGREVALKVSANVGQEAKTLASLEHDNIVKVHLQTAMPERNLRFICMQYVAGCTLADVIRDLAARDETMSGASVLEYLRSVGPLEQTSESPSLVPDQPLLEMDFQEVALWLGVRLAGALAYAHDNGVLHLDVKPSNVLLSRRGRPYLTDFNVSLDHRQIRRNEAPMLGGTVEYMAPEQKALIESKGDVEAINRIDHRADLYALGVVMREFLGQASTGEGIDLSIRMVVGKCTAADPKARFQSALALSQALEGCLELREITKSLARPGIGLALAARFPLLSTSVVALVPQFIASWACFRLLPLALPETFSASYLGEQTAALVLGADLLCSFLWTLWLLPLFHGLSTPRTLLTEPTLGPSLRRRILGIPNVIFSLATLVWLPAHLLAFGVNTTSGEILPIDATGTLLMVVVLAGLTASASSALLCQLLALRLIYPRLWVGSYRVHVTAKAELSDIGNRLRVFYFTLGWAPMTAAAFSIFDPVFSGWQLTSLLSCLLATGLAGILFDFSISHRLARLAFVFGGIKPARSASGNRGDPGH